MRIIKGLYGIIDTSIIPLHLLKEMALKLLDGGVRTLQLRAKELSPRDQLKIAAGLAKLVSGNGGIFIVNDRADVALLSGADGVHLGQEDIPCSATRRILGGRYVIGVSTHNREEALKAEADGADYIAFGPIFHTTTKKDAQMPKGVKELKKIKEVVKIPVVAIGGINEDNLKEVLETGVDGVAMASDILASNDISKKVERIVSLLKCKEIEIRK